MIRGQQMLAGSNSPLSYWTNVRDGLCLAYAACLRNCASEDDRLELDGWVTVNVQGAIEYGEDERRRRTQRAMQFAVDG